MASFCTNCGQGFTGNERFCGTCGTPAPDPFAGAPAGTMPEGLPPLVAPRAAPVVVAGDPTGGEVSWSIVGWTALGGALAGLVLGIEAWYPDYPPFVQPSFILALALTGALIAAGPRVGEAVTGRGPVDVESLAWEAGAGATAGAVAAIAGELLLDTILEEAYFNQSAALWFAVVWGTVVGLAPVLPVLTGRRSKQHLGATIGYGYLFGAVAGGLIWLVTVQLELGSYEPGRPLMAVALALVGAAAGLAPPLAARSAARPSGPAHPGLQYQAAPVTYAPAVAGQPATAAYAAVGLAPQGTNGLAVAAFVLGLLGISLLGFIFGLVALGQINRTGGIQGGRGLAIAGVVISSLWFLATVALYAAIAAA